MAKKWIKDLEKQLEGEIHTDKETIKKHSTDASIFQVTPEIVVYPHDVEDVKKLVKFVNKNKKKNLSLTGRAAGTDMSGGPLSESIIVSFSKFFNHIKAIRTSDNTGIVEPGVYYRDFEKESLKRGLYFPSYPASKTLCAWGGIIANNSGGEKSLTFGKTQDHVKRLKVVLSDGNEYVFEPLTKKELDKKMKQKDFEGKIYRDVYKLIEDTKKIIKHAKPKVSKNSAGYFLWNVWDGKTFDLTQLFVGSQGTLGLWTEAEVNLVKKKKHSRLVAAFINDLEVMTEFVNTVLPYKPESLEAFDDETLKLAIKFLPDIAKKLKSGFLNLVWGFKREAFLTLIHGFPKFVVLVEITGDDEKEIEKKEAKLHKELNKMKIPNLVMHSEKEGEKYWTMRRQSFSLLRNKVKDKKATPFVDDFCVQPKHLPEFLPKMYEILKENGISPTLAGHAGSGNFHIIPLMDLTKKEVRDKIPIVSEKVYELIAEYDGTITAEHNDGLIRTPYLEQMYGKEVIGLFEKVKDIFDPDGIFNPGKKVHGDLDYAMKHIKTTLD